MYNLRALHFLHVSIAHPCLFIALSACDQQKDNNTSYAEKHEGTVVHIGKKDVQEEDDPYEGWYYMVVVSDVEDINISNKTVEELEDLAREKDGSYYNVDPNMNDELDLEVGTVVIYYKGQGDSDAPVRDAEKIDAVFH